MPSLEITTQNDLFISKACLNEMLQWKQLANGKSVQTLSVSLSLSLSLSVSRHKTVLDSKACDVIRSKMTAVLSKQ